MNPVAAEQALGEMFIMCTGWTDDLVEAWVRKTAAHCTDAGAIAAASTTWVNNAKERWVPAFGAWMEVYWQEIRHREMTRPALRSGEEEISLAEHIRRLKLRTDAEGKVELARWRKVPGDVFGSEWRAALGRDPA